VGRAPCLDVVRRRLEAGGRLDEGALAELCTEAADAPPQRCEFLAEALALAAARPGFQPDQFCSDIERAQFCSRSMDRLLVSQPVADLAYGECLRAERAGGEDDAYCKRFRDMLSYAVRNDDLDTMRACYVIQAAAGSNASAGTTPSEVPRMRIITGGEDLSDLGFGTAADRPRTGNSGIVLRPEGLDDFGRGGAAPIPERPGTIIVEPRPVRAGAGHFLLEPAPPAAPPPAAAHGGSPALRALPGRVQVEGPASGEARLRAVAPAAVSVAAIAVPGRVAVSPLRPHEAARGNSSGLREGAPRPTLQRPRAAAEIVTRQSPLSPVAGRLSLHLPLQRQAPTAARAGTGLAQQGSTRAARTGKLGERKLKAARRRDGQGEYNGFLSKFVQ